MASLTINGLEKCFRLVCGVGETDVTFRVADIYTAWLDWTLLGENTKFGQAFTNSGGADVGGGEALGLAYFLNVADGWRICPQTTEAEVRILLDGNLFPNQVGTGMFDYMYVVGSGHTHIEMRTSTLPSIIETGVSGLTPTESAILSSNNALAIQIKDLNDQILRLAALIPATL